MRDSWSGSPRGAMQAAVAATPAFAFQTVTASPTARGASATISAVMQVNFVDFILPPPAWFRQLRIDKSFRNRVRLNKARSYRLSRAARQFKPQSRSVARVELAEEKTEEFPKCARVRQSACVNRKHSADTGPSRLRKYCWHKRY